MQMLLGKPVCKWLKAQRNNSASAWRSLLIGGVEQ